MVPTRFPEAEIPNGHFPEWDISRKLFSRILFPECQYPESFVSRMKKKTRFLSRHNFQIIALLSTKIGSILTKENDVFYSSGDLNFQYNDLFFASFLERSLNKNLKNIENFNTQAEQKGVIFSKN